jgi:hypothetical protein
MKKITSLVFSILALVTAASAQVVVNQKDFSKDPDKYIDQIITIKGVPVLRMTPFEYIRAAEKSRFAYYCDSVGPQTTIPRQNAFPACHFYKGQKLVNVDFQSSSKWNGKACFYMTDAMYSSLPEKSKCTITFKGNIRYGFYITGLAK